ncbi:acyl-CoA dehydrogenase family protein [Pseudonocardia ailaonensis]|uniref:Acyl-CoA dehydrogenase family protein n=1 Tax=Pseudonocardia ailaonensis TaxID=367279 RepID=A0ABN2N6S0_9PSEU
MLVDTQEQADLRAAVRTLARSYGHEYYLEASRSGRKMDELWHDLGKYGFLGVHLPVEYGGGGAGITELAIVCEELAAAGTPSLLIIVSAAICSELIGRYGTAEQKSAWVPRLAAGEAKMAFSITEPDAGLNTLAMTTTAVRDGDDYVVNGRKYYASGVDEADAVVVVVRTGADEHTGRARLSLLLVDPDAPGLERQQIPTEVVSTEKQFSLFFDNVRVPADRLLGTEGEGLTQVFNGLNPERILAAALENGIATYALDKASRYAVERKVWGVPIGQHQGIAHPLAKAKIEVELARLMTSQAAALHDAGLDAGAAANMAKYAAAEAALGALDQAMQTHGGNGLATEYGLATLWGITRLQRTAPVSREMIFNYVAQRMLSLPRSY